MTVNAQTTSKRRAARLTAAIMGALAVMTIGITPAAAAPPSTATGPSTTTAPYVLPVPDDVKITSLLTVGDSRRRVERLRDGRYPGRHRLCARHRQGRRLPEPRVARRPRESCVATA